MRLLILGGTRFIGWHIASTYAQERWAPRRGVSPRLNAASGTFRHRGNSERADEFRRFRPEAVIDCIGYTSPAGAKIVETFKGWLERLVFLSSCDVYERIK
jgi:nucleoside-diphosphate-sugar epimerase